MRYLLFCIVIVLMASCQKEISLGGGTTPPTPTVKCTGCNYLPVCDSTRLTYQDSSALGLDTTSSTLTILGDTTIGGKKFNKVSPSAAFGQGLVYNCDGGEYKVFQAVPDLGIDVDSLLQSVGLPGGGITIPSQIQTTILKTGAAAGATWSDVVFTYAPIPFLTITASLDYKLEAKNTSRTVLGRNYTNVMQVSSKLNVAIPQTPSPIDLRVDTWYADGIGIIETRTTMDGEVQAATKIISYKIR